jgi:ubiquinone/menaquinone biosynthesis C-methylase UbiE
MKSLGQDANVWTESWSKVTPESEIRMWDFYGGRQWISKFVPRYGKTVEAGCGFGRYVFYFNRMGINIEGIDFSETIINFLNEWKKGKNFDVNFKVGDVTNLPYENESIRGYISLGVIEHFIEGPAKPLKEAYRVLEPGGVAIITTPSISWYVFLRNIKTKSKDIIKKLIRYKSAPREFFQYEYRPKKLKKFVEASGLLVTEYDGCDLLYSFTELGNFKGDNLKPGSFAYKFSNKFENSYLRKIGSQSITISIKLGNKMYCFLCSEKKATLDSLKIFSVPMCDKCKSKDIARYYIKGVLPKFAAPYLINPPIKKPTKEICEFSGEEYITDMLFEDYGFTKKVSPNMLKVPEINIKLCNESLQPIWRKRISE